MAHSLQLSLLTASVSTLIGVALGVLLGKTDLPLRGSLTLLFTVAAPHSLLMSWPWLGFPSWVGPGCSAAVLPDSWSQKISSEFFGLSGCTFVLATAFTPIAMLLTIAFLRTVNPRLENAGRLVSGWPSILLRITLPLMLPAISFAAVLIFLLSIGEISVPMYLRFPVYPVETLTQFAAFYDFRAANVAASPLFLLTLIILGLQTGLHKRVLQLGRRTPSAEMVLIALGRWRVPLWHCCWHWPSSSLCCRLGALVVQSHSLETYGAALARAGESVLRSVAFAAIARHAADRTRLFLGLSRRAPDAFPSGGSMSGLRSSFSHCPDRLSASVSSAFGTIQATNFIYASPAILILGYLAQYAMLPMRVVSASLAAVPRSLEEAAWLSGAGWLATLRHIVAPLAGRGLLAAWLISYVFCVRDVAISIVVYPPGYDTLPVRILTLMANGAPSLIAALCIILIAITLLPLGAAGLWLKFGASAPVSKIEFRSVTKTLSRPARCRCPFVHDRSG